MKIKRLPEFVLNVHYRELSPKEGGNKYRWVTLKDIEVVHDQCLTHHGETINFKDRLGRIWLTFKGYVSIVRAGYAWNGCSPKIHTKLFGWMGTPDHIKTRLASLWHDAGCQFELTLHMPLRRIDIDAVFYEIMKLNKYLFRGLFHGVVRRIGPLFGSPQDVYSESINELDLGV